jgi:hypothetical protein
MKDQIPVFEDSRNTLAKSAPFVAFAAIILAVSFAHAQAPAIPPDVQAALLSVESDKLALATATSAATAAQAALTTAQGSVATGNTTLASDLAKLQAVLASHYPIVPPAPTPTPVPPTPTPTPPTPSGPVVSLLVLSDPETCVPCKQYQPILAATAATGIPIQTMSLSDPAASQYKATAEPTTILLVNGKEPGDGPAVTRALGVHSQAALVDWWTRNQNIYNPKKGQ